MKQIRVMIIADIEVGDEFDIVSDLVLAKYVEDTTADTELALLKDKDFTVVDYIETKEI